MLTMRMNICTGMSIRMDRGKCIRTNMSMNMSMSMSTIMNMVMFTVTLISIHMKRSRNTLKIRKQETVIRTGTWRILKG